MFCEVSSEKIYDFSILIGILSFDPKEGLDWLDVKSYISV